MHVVGGSLNQLQLLHLHMTCLFQQATSLLRIASITTAICMFCSSSPPPSSPAPVFVGLIIAHCITPWCPSCVVCRSVWFRP